MGVKVCRLTNPSIRFRLRNRLTSLRKADVRNKKRISGLESNNKELSLELANIRIVNQQLQASVVQFQEDAMQRHEFIVALKLRVQEQERDLSAIGDVFNDVARLAVGISDRLNSGFSLCQAGRRRSRSISAALHAVFGTDHSSPPTPTACGDVENDEGRPAQNTGMPIELSLANSSESAVTDANADAECADSTPGIASVPVVCGRVTVDTDGLLADSDDIDGEEEDDTGVDQKRVASRSMGLSTIEERSEYDSTMSFTLSTPSVSNVRVSSMGTCESPTLGSNIDFAIPAAPASRVVSCPATDLSPALPATPPVEERELKLDDTLHMASPGSVVLGSTVSSNKHKQLISSSQQLLPVESSAAQLPTADKRTSNCWTRASDAFMSPVIARKVARQACREKPEASEVIKSSVDPAVKPVVCDRATADLAVDIGTTSCAAGDSTRRTSLLKRGSRRSRQHCRRVSFFAEDRSKTIATLKEGVTAEQDADPQQSADCSSVGRDVVTVVGRPSRKSVVAPHEASSSVDGGVVENGVVADIMLSNGVDHVTVDVPSENQLKSDATPVEISPVTSGKSGRRSRRGSSCSSSRGRRSHGRRPAVSEAAAVSAGTSDSADSRESTPDGDCVARQSRRRRHNNISYKEPPMNRKLRR